MINLLPLAFGRSGRIEFGLVMLVLFAGAYVSSRMPGVRFVPLAVIPCLFIWASARRLHDLGRSGLWSLVFFVSGFFVGFTRGSVPAGVTDLATTTISILTVLYCLALAGWPGNRGPNRFGPARRAVAEKTPELFD